jgi:hypothetical protein
VILRPVLIHYSLNLITVYFTITPKFSMRRIVLRVDKSSLVLNVNVISVLMPLLSIFCPEI